MSTHGTGRGRGGSLDRWLLSYADLVTLLLVFFVAMYAVSTVDAEKVGTAASSVRVAFSGDITPAGPVPILEPAGVEGAPAADFSELRQELATALADAIEGGRVELIDDARGLVVSLPESATFATGSADVADGMLDLIARIATTVQPHGHALRIEGHTDDMPIRTRAFRSNWELSTARASTVIRLLIERVAFDPRRLSAAGYAEFHPRFANDSPANRARNRRVDIVILRGVS